MTAATEWIMEFDSPEQAYKVVRRVATSEASVIACASTDAAAFMRDAAGFPHEGVPVSEEWP